MYATHILMITEAFDGMKPASFAILLPFYVPFILEVGIRNLCDDRILLSLLPLAPNS